MKKGLENAGQTIVEAIVVISVVVVLVTGLIAGTTTSLKSAQNGRARSQATKYAQEGIEFARSMRDQSWSTFQTYSGVYCFAGDLTFEPATQSSCEVNIHTVDNAFTRTLTFSLVGQKMTVTSKVTFPTGSTLSDVTLVTYLTDWR